MKYNELPMPLQEVISEMCRIVGADPMSLDYKSHDWFMSHEWTKDEQDAFTDWLTNKLYNNPELRRTFEISHRNKKYLRKEAEAFSMWYGWKTKKT